MGYATVGTGLGSILQAMFNPSILRFDTTAATASNDIIKFDCELSDVSSIGYNVTIDTVGVGTGTVTVKVGVTTVATITRTGGAGTTTENGLIDVTSYGGLHTITVTYATTGDTGYITNTNLWMVK